MHASSVEWLGSDGSVLERPRQTQGTGHALDVPLSFLTPGRRSVAEICADGPGAHWLDKPLPVTISRVRSDAPESEMIVSMHG